MAKYDQTAPAPTAFARAFGAPPRHPQGLRPSRAALTRYRGPSGEERDTRPARQTAPHQPPRQNSKKWMEGKRQSPRLDRIPLRQAGARLSGTRAGPRPAKNAGQVAVKPVCGALRACSHLRRACGVRRADLGVGRSARKEGGKPPLLLALVFQPVSMRKLPAGPPEAHPAAAIPQPARARTARGPTSRSYPRAQPVDNWERRVRNRARRDR